MLIYEQKDCKEKGENGMLDGKYKAVDDIHIFDCDLGQLKIPKGKEIEVKEHGYTACADGIKFPGKFLDICKTQVQRICE